MNIHLARLPDINTDRQLQVTPYWAYGRFAILTDGSLWFGDLYSSHPSTTKVGWYWAIDRAGDLSVSARGAGIDGEILVRDRRDSLAWLVAELVKRRVIRKPCTIYCL
jgi:hypothetical protein